MADYGPVKLRILSFSEGALVGQLALYTAEAGVYGDPTALYETEAPIVVLDDMTVPYAYTTTVTGFQLDTYENPTPSPLEIDYTPIVAGVLQPIDPLAPPEQLTLLVKNYYAGGILQVGAYANGEFYVLGEHEIGLDDWFGLTPIPLTALPVPETPRFWTGLQRAVELIGEAS
jgi:hypothetical protein